MWVCVWKLGYKLKYGCILNPENGLFSAARQKAPKIRLCYFWWFSLAIKNKLVLLFMARKKPPKIMPLIFTGQLKVAKNKKSFIFSCFSRLKINLIFSTYFWQPDAAKNKAIDEKNKLFLVASDCQKLHKFL
jgi:hypothetical protein